MKTTIKNSWNAVKGGVNKTVEAVKKPVKIILYTTLGFGVVGTAGAATDINYNNGEITKTTLKRSGVDNKTIDDVVATLDRTTGDAKLPKKKTGVEYTEPEDNPTTPKTPETMDGNTTPTVTLDANGNITSETNSKLSSGDVTLYNRIPSNNPAKVNAIYMLSQLAKDNTIASQTNREMLEYFTILTAHTIYRAETGSIKKSDLIGSHLELPLAKWDTYAGTSQTVAASWKAITELANMVANPRETKDPFAGFDYAAAGITDKEWNELTFEDKKDMAAMMGVVIEAEAEGKKLDKENEGKRNEIKQLDEEYEKLKKNKGE